MTLFKRPVSILNSDERWGIGACGATTLVIILTICGGLADGEARRILLTSALCVLAGLFGAISGTSFLYWKRLETHALLPGGGETTNPDKCGSLAASIVCGILAVSSLIGGFLTLATC